MDSNPLHRALNAEANCKHVSAEELQICWGDNPSYWEMVRDKNSIMFPKKIARLKEVCWFDVKDEIMCSLPPGAHTVSWRAHLSPGSRGWVSEPVHFTFSKNETEVVSECKCCIDRTSFGVLSSQTQMEQYSLPTKRAVENGWTEYDVWEFVVEEGEENCALKFSMVATGGRWKSGLSLDGIFIRPKGLMDVVPAQLLRNRADCDAGPSHSTIAANTIKEDVEVSRVELEEGLAVNEGDCDEEDEEDKYEEDENEEEQDQDDEDSHRDVSLNMEPAHGTYMRFREFYHIPSTVPCECFDARDVSSNKSTFLPKEPEYSAWDARDTSEVGEEMLQSLSQIDSWAASQFGLKDLAVKDFIMRLYYEKCL